MTLKSILTPDTSVLVGLANASLVLAIYNQALPKAAAVRTADPHDTDIEAARKGAAWTSAGALGFMFLLTRDRNSLLIGGLVLAGVDMLVKHSNGMNPMTGMLHDDRADSLDDTEANIYPLPDYNDADDSEMGVM